MNPIELRQLKAQKLDEADALVKNMQTDEQRAQVDTLLTEAETLEADAKRVERLEGFRGVNKPQPTAYKKATPDTEEGLFFRWLRRREPAVEAELRAYNNTDMNIGTAADGGVLVPTTLVRDIVARRDEMALHVQLGCRRVPGVGTTVDYPIDNEADVVFAAVSEGGNVLQDAPALTKKSFTLAKYGKYITLSWELLRDEDASLRAFLTDWISRGWAGTMNQLLVTEVLANGTAGLTLDAAAAIGAAEIPELVGKLMPEYQTGGNVAWLMHPTTFAYINGLNATSQFLFAPTPGATGAGAELWGFPMHRTSYMTALAASVKSLVFGNFNYMGYRSPTDITTLFDPYTGAGTGQQKLWVWFDAIFGVLQAEAFQYATHPTG